MEITTEIMTKDRWISLLRAAGVENLDDVKMVPVSGPCITPNGGEFHVYVTHDHLDHLTNLWPDIEETWNGSDS